MTNLRTVTCTAYPDAPVQDLNEPDRHGHPIGYSAGPRCAGRLTAKVTPHA